jgi:hypothetical protein
VKLKLRAVLSLCFERGVHRAAGVDHQHVPGFEEVAEVSEPGVDHAAVAHVGDQQAYLVALEAPCLGWLARLELLRQVEVERRESLIGGLFYEKGLYTHRSPLLRWSRARAS